MIQPAYNHECKYVVFHSSYFNNYKLFKLMENKVHILSCATTLYSSSPNQIFIEMYFIFHIGNCFLLHMGDNLVFSKMPLLKKLRTARDHIKMNIVKLLTQSKIYFEKLPSLKFLFYVNLSRYLGILYFSYCLLICQGIGTSVHFFEVKKTFMNITFNRIKFTSVRFLTLHKTAEFYFGPKNRKIHNQFMSSIYHAHP